MSKSQDQFTQFLQSIRNRVPAPLAIGDGCPKNCRTWESAGGFRTYAYPNGLIVTTFPSSVTYEDAPKAPRAGTRLVGCVAPDDLVAHLEEMFLSEDTLPPVKRNRKAASSPADLLSDWTPEVQGPAREEESVEDAETIIAE